MQTALLDYDLPESAIAVHPTEARDGARLLVMGQSGYQDRAVRDWPELLPEGCVVVLNDSRVRRARLLGKRAGTGGRVELLLLERMLPDPPEAGVERWRALGRASKPLRPGACLEFEKLRVQVTELLEDGEFEVAISAAGGVESALDQVGAVPIPPYLRRGEEASDRERYQTVYATKLGSVAAPTAGLHLTREMLERIQARGIQMVSVTLHVGPGTFKPVTVEDLDRHSMHTEWYEIPTTTATIINRAHEESRRVVAVGTTVVRALESAKSNRGIGSVSAGMGRTRLLIQPGYEFHVVDALLTNFHLPASTLLALVSAFAGHRRTLEGYKEALRRGYRFLSYGDAMWIPERRLHE